MKYKVSVSQYANDHYFLAVWQQTEWQQEICKQLGFQYLHCFLIHMVLILIDF